MFRKVFLEVKKSPTSHLLWVGSLVSLIAGVLAWQYCKGYFNALGINVSYSHLENVVFVFDQALKFSYSELYPPLNSRFYLSLYGLGPFIIIVSLLLKRSLAWASTKGWLKKLPSGSTQTLKGDSLFDDNHLNWISVGSFLFIFSFFRVETMVAALSLSFFAGWACLNFVRDVWSEQDRWSSGRPFLAFFVVVGTLVFANYVGWLDAKRLQALNFINLDTVCLSSTLSRVGTDRRSDRGGFLQCGKLVFSDSNSICLMPPDEEHPTCYRRGHYEVTTIVSEL
ncbi:hypothetical protein K2X33_09900 [bacterium]|nr:hypothetical protein [bacterium]